MAKREVPEINAGSMADIAFLLLIFFIVATTMDHDTGITRILPPIPENQVENSSVKVKERNILAVLINKDDQVMVEGKLIDIVDLKGITVDFFSNPLDNPDLPEKELIRVNFPEGQSSGFPDGSAEIFVSKGIVSLQNDRSTSYGRYLEVQNELVAGINELRNQFSIKYFGKKYDDLDSRKTIDAKIIEGISKIYKMNISEAEPKNVGGKK
jgi:hypothetical protein